METVSINNPVKTVKLPTDDAGDDTVRSLKKQERVTTIPRGSTHKRVEVRETQTGNAVG